MKDKFNGYDRKEHFGLIQQRLCKRKMPLNLNRALIQNEDLYESIFDQSSSSTCDFLTCPNCIKGLLLKNENTIYCTNDCVSYNGILAETLNEFVYIFKQKIKEHNKQCLYPRWSIVNMVNKEIVCIICKNLYQG